MDEKIILKDFEERKFVDKPLSMGNKEATVKLLKDHFHGGIFFIAGSEIKVDETSLRFIEEHKIGKRV